MRRAVTACRPDVATRPVWRVRGRRPFTALQRDGRRVRVGPVALTWVALHDDSPPRVAFAVGKRVGSAVVRNRLRRRLRAATAEVAGQLGPGIYLISAAPEAAALSPDELRAIVSQVCVASQRDQREQQP